MEIFNKKFDVFMVLVNCSVVFYFYYFCKMYWVFEDLISLFIVIGVFVDSKNCVELCLIF